MQYSPDERAIRELVATWQRATLSGDLPTLLNLMSQDVVFLAPGQAPLRGREGFTRAFQAAMQRVRISAASEIQEIRIVADMAYCWSFFTVATTPLNGQAQLRRRGHTLTILRKTREGNWVITRDANMLAVEG
jgi:uncharacterized protein (TIGR02246 family)